MKKIVTLSLGICLMIAAHAQTKITKTSVLGKWVISVVEMKGTFYYNIEKDSLELGEAIKSQVPDPSQMDMVKTMTKSQLSALTKLSFQFNSDGTALLNSGEGDPKPTTYTVDEEKSTITTVDAEAKETTTLKGEIIKEKLQLIMSQPQGEFILLLKKA